MPAHSGWPCAAASGAVMRPVSVYHQDFVAAQPEANKGSAAAIMNRRARILMASP